MSRSSPWRVSGALNLFSLPSMPALFESNPEEPENGDYFDELDPELQPESPAKSKKGGRLSRFSRGEFFPARKPAAGQAATSGRLYSARLSAHRLSRQSQDLVVTPAERKKLQRQASRKIESHLETWLRDNGFGQHTEAIKAIGGDDLNIFEFSEIATDDELVDDVGFKKLEVRKFRIAINATRREAIRQQSQSPSASPKSPPLKRKSRGQGAEKMNRINTNSFSSFNSTYSEEDGGEGRVAATLDNTVNPLMNEKLAQKVQRANGTQHHEG